MHVTLRFYGPTTPAQLAALREGTLATVGAGAPEISVIARGVDGFPRAAKARVVVVALEDGGGLAEIARAAEAHAIALGFAPEARSFKAHLTLARLKEPRDLRPICAEPLALPPAHITGITLYESKTLPSGPVYTPLCRW